MVWCQQYIPVQQPVLGTRFIVFRSQGIYDLPPNASSVLRTLADRTAAANAANPSGFSLDTYLSPSNLGFESVESESTSAKTATTFTLAINGGQNGKQINASMEAFAAAFNASLAKTKLFQESFALHVCDCQHACFTLRTRTHLTNAVTSLHSTRWCS